MESQIFATHFTVLLTSKCSYLLHRFDTNTEISTRYRVPQQNLCRLASIELYCPILVFQRCLSVHHPASAQHFQVYPSLVFVGISEYCKRQIFFYLTRPLCLRRRGGPGDLLPVCIRRRRGDMFFISLIFCVGF